MLSAIDGVRVAFLCTKNRSRLEEMAFNELEIVRNHPKYADLLIAKKLASVYSRVFL